MATKARRNRELFDALIANGGNLPLRPRILDLAGPLTDAESCAKAITGELIAFTITGNGAFLWRAYQRAREGHVAIPDAVLSYFDGCADAVLFGGRDSAITARMLLRNRRGGASPGIRANSAHRQVSILSALVYEYHRVQTGELPSKVAARRRVARMFRTTEGRIHQLEVKAGM